MIKIDNRQIKILLVDDTAVNLEIAGRILKKENYDLYLADSGYTALGLIKDIPFDLILMDIMMPDLDGFETYKIIAKNKKYNNVPVIFLTAKVDIESVVKGFELGAVDYIRKPFNEMELKTRVRNHIELKKMREELEEKNKSLLEANEKLEIIATIDPLTNLLNRREMMKRMESEKKSFQRYKQPFALIIVDIDFFKKVNDTYGHSFGDFVLTSLAKLLKSNVRIKDHVCRWGGEEFLILLHKTDSQEALVLVEKLRKIVEESNFVDDTFQTRITATFGISIYSEIQDINCAISKVDKALYEGKDKGRNCLVINE